MKFSIEFPTQQYSVTATLPEVLEKFASSMPENEDILLKVVRWIANANIASTYTLDCEELASSIIITRIA